MIAFPHAKINLGLRIQERLENGYHRIESIFYPIPLCDILEIVHSEQQGLALSCSGIEIPEGKNIISSAAERFFEGMNATPQLSLHLHKCIPLGAGLGGGSSDGASTLKLLNNIFPNHHTEDAVRKIAAELGSDCSFFMSDNAGYLNGVGAEIESFDFSLSGYHIALINTGIHVSTASAYKNCQPKLREDDLRDFIHADVSEWKANLHNDFEDSVFKAHPSLKEIKDALYDAGATYASMSGSGSTIYGLFKESPSLHDPYSDCFYWEGKLN